MLTPRRVALAAAEAFADGLLALEFSIDMVSVAVFEGVQMRRRCRNPAYPLVSRHLLPLLALAASFGAIVNVVMAIYCSVQLKNSKPKSTSKIASVGASLAKAGAKIEPVRDWPVNRASVRKA